MESIIGILSIIITLLVTMFIILPIGQQRIYDSGNTNKAIMITTIIDTALVVMTLFTTMLILSFVASLIN